MNSIPTSTHFGHYFTSPSPRSRWRLKLMSGVLPINSADTQTLNKFYNILRTLHANVDSN